MTCLNTLGSPTRSGTGAQADRAAAGSLASASMGYRMLVNAACVMAASCFFDGIGTRETVP